MKKKLIKIGELTTLFSFLLGTILLLLYFFTDSSSVLLIGYISVILIGLFNLIILIILLVKALNDTANRKKYLKTVGLMLINIPITIAYFFIVLTLLNTMRITFINTMDSTISEINIYGCQDAHIDALEAGEKKTVWISISGDCAINIIYIYEGQEICENVMGYTCSFNGQKINYKIGSNIQTNNNSNKDSVNLKGNDSIQIVELITTGTSVDFLLLKDSTLQEDFFSLLSSAQKADSDVNNAEITYLLDITPELLNQLLVEIDIDSLKINNWFENEYDLDIGTEDYKESDLCKDKIILSFNKETLSFTLMMRDSFLNKADWCNETCVGYIFKIENNKIAEFRRFLAG